MRRNAREIDHPVSFQLKKCLVARDRRAAKLDRAGQACRAEFPAGKAR
jgi:hypothetical protein